MAIPVDSFGSELPPVAMEPATPFNATAIRNTSAHTAAADCRRVLRKVVSIVNTLDQAVTLTLAYAADEAGSVAVAAFTSGVSVPAGATRWFAAQGGSLGSHVQEARLDNYTPYLLMTLQCSVAPASGAVTVRVFGYNA